MTKSIHNSTSSPLPPNGEFLGRTEQVDAYNGIIVNVHTDADGTLFVEQSIDGVNFDYVFTKQILANTEVTCNIDIEASEMRVKYVNGGTGQFFLRLQTILSEIVNPNPALADLKSEIAALAGTISETHMMHSGIVSNASTGSAVQPGFSGSISTMIVQTTNTPFIRPLLQGDARYFYVTSTNTNNRASTSTGLYEVKVVGLDNNLQPQEEIVQIEGTDNVITVNQYLHVNGLVAITGELVSGDIYVFRGVDIVRYAGILRYGVNNEYCNGWYMAAAGKQTIIRGISGFTTSATSMYLYKYEAGSHSKNQIYRIFDIRQAGNSVQGLKFNYQLLPGESIYWFNASSNVTALINVEIEINNLS